MDSFDLIIFDCDGTLTDSEALNNRATIEILHECGFTEYTTENSHGKWIGYTMSKIILMIQMETGRMVPEDFIRRYARRVAELQQTGLVAVGGAASLVSRAGKKFKICVASNGERTNVLTSLEITGLMDGNFTPDNVFTKIQVKNPKPYPDLFLFAAEKMGTEPSRCLVIEDSAAGVMAGVSAGMTVWGFSGSAHDPEKQEQALLSAGAHAVFPRLIHIQDQLGL